MIFSHFDLCACLKPAMIIQDKIEIHFPFAKGSYIVSIIGLLRKTAKQTPSIGAFHSDQSPFSVPPPAFPECALISSSYI